MLLKLNLSDSERIGVFLNEAILPAPFFADRPKALRHVWQSLFSVKARIYGLFTQNKLTALMIFKKQTNDLHLENLLFSRYSTPDKKNIQQAFFMIGQKEFVQTIYFGLSEQLFGAKLAIPKVKTALVLGGGGARGAYQVGAMQAFLGAGFTFDLICGTSVGGLNGALFLNGDIDQAIQLWETIETGKILAFEQPVDSARFKREFLKTALREAGISSAPLKKLILDYSNVDLIQKNTCPLYIVTIQVPSFKEVVVDMQKVPPEEFADWLVASASFFPGMAVAEIAGEFYMDGGYKNNLPQDVAVAHGAKRLVSIDAKGPGMIKKISHRLPELMVKSPWALGEVLSFTAQTAQENLQLGFLETQKLLQQAQGYWYTFTNESLQQQLKLSRRFLQQKKINITPGIYRSLTHFYGQNVTPANLGLALLETLGRFWQVSPAVLYTLPEFCQKLRQQALKNQENPFVPRLKWETNNPSLLLQRRQLTRHFHGEKNVTLHRGALKIFQQFVEFLQEEENGNPI
ncbi:patatin-like phospholipase family protein [Enterococcus timonensis]|uniref:patatin-like phospholipase family protein n=1 Tax=Enterococcus timonensis TaxID=1852364 RepID=UPI0008D96CA7|nr:patatin-like phospholipase family protein [Enterococcus timonensis]